MNHPFTKSQLDISKCTTCNRGVIEHTKYAKCESCSNTGPCDIFDDILMCDACRIKHESVVKSVISDVESNVNELLERSRTLDQKIITSADIFNAQTIANAEIKRAIDNDENIPNKVGEYQKILMERFVQFQNAIFEKDTVIHKETIAKNEMEHQQLAIIKDLRALGNELRSEYREKLKIADTHYAPIQAKVPSVKVKRVTKDPFERMVEVYQANMASKNILITLDEARETLKKNMKG